MLFIVLQFSLCFGLRPSLWSSGEWTRRHNIHISYSRVPVSNTLRERRSMNIIISMIIILKLESKRCKDLASSTYIQWFKCKLCRKTRCFDGEPFPSPLEACLHVLPWFRRFASRVHDFYYSFVRNNDQQNKVEAAHA